MRGHSSRYSALALAVEGSVRVTILAWLRARRIWFRALRPQASSLTVVATAMAGLLAGAPSPLVVAFALWAFWYHLVGFADNNLCDLPYDRRDPSKAMFPTVTGEIPEASLRRFVRWGTAMGLAGAVLLIAVYAAAPGPALAVLAAAVASGFLYNRRNKFDRASSAYFALGFTSAAALPYAAFRGLGDPLLWAFYAYGFLYLTYMIAVTGDYKEVLRADQKNILRALGLRVTAGVLEPGRVGQIAVAAKLLTFAPLYALSGVVWSWDALLLLTATVVASVALVGKMFEPGPFDRDKRWRLAISMEVLSAVSWTAAFLPWVGYPFLVGSVLFSVAWFVAWNYVLYGTWWPRV